MELKNTSRNRKRSFSIGVLIFVSGTVSFAQEQTADAVIQGMMELGINTEGLVLSEEQVLEIQGIIGGTAVDPSCCPGRCCPGGAIDEDTAKVEAINRLLGL